MADRGQRSPRPAVVHLRRNPRRLPHLRTQRADQSPPVPPRPPRWRAVLRSFAPVLWRPEPIPDQPPVVTAAIRAWARANGYQVPPRGRIPSEVREAWDRHNS
ncbi:Lsr2 family protein [Streptomyces flavotricini]|uniref:Lsr2 family protein n=1 Tax=Streptomyces flavotricini TaxID=66888 RepID=A0ABS8EI40_9ACTN|nr:Lsr2 family protein [Streptomyces flavotricini]